MKEKLPALLSSKEGLNVACGLFNILDAKDRKIALKSLPVTEMATNKIAHLYLAHVANTLDDTQLTKKKLLHECIKGIDDMIGDKCFQTVIISSLLRTGETELKNNSLTASDLVSFNTLIEHTTSKKDNATRC